MERGTWNLVGIADDQDVNVLIARQRRGDLAPPCWKNLSSASVIAIGYYSVVETRQKAWLSAVQGGWRIRPEWTEVNVIDQKIE